jgi:hypothetical protein
MGLRVDIFRSDYDSTLNTFNGRDSVIVTNVEGPSFPTENETAAILSKNAFGDPILIPDNGRMTDIGPMFGGTYAATSDSRFGKATGVYGAIPIHDRFETPEQYRMLST